MPWKLKSYVLLGRVRKKLATTSESKHASAQCVTMHWLTLSQMVLWRAALQPTTWWESGKEGISSPLTKARAHSSPLVKLHMWRQCTECKRQSQLCFSTLFKAKPSGCMAWRKFFGISSECNVGSSLLSPLSLTTYTLDDWTCVFYFKSAASTGQSRQYLKEFEPHREQQNLNSGVKNCAAGIAHEATGQQTKGSVDLY
eukprot:2595747-Amphidinium_carterae.1